MSENLCVQGEPTTPESGLRELWQNVANQEPSWLGNQEWGINKAVFSLFFFFFIWDFSVKNSPKATISGSED